VNEPPPPVVDDRGRPRRAPRVGDSRAPVTTALVLVAAVICVVAGFVVLRSITDPSAGPDEVVSGASTAAVTSPPSTPPPTSSTSTSTTTAATTTTTTTIAPRVAKAAAPIVVANASGVDRSATAMTADLDAAGYTTAPVANSTGPRLERSVIYYVEGSPAPLAVARLLAEQIPTAQVQPMPARPPLDRPLGDATVALILGLDAAGRALGEPAG